jgi:DNA-binding PadR family transcriptional regulator
MFGKDRITMTCGYAATSPWLWFEREATMPDWVAKMTSGQSYRAKHAFGTWAMWGGPQWGPMWSGGRGPKARRGDVRAAILAVLAENAMNGYQIIQQVAERSGGVWKPSPGSIYPTLQQLEDEGLVRAETDGGRRTYVLTDEGRAYVTEHADEVAAPWTAISEAADDSEDIRPLIGQIATAMWQIVSVGTPEQQRKGREALADLRRRLHTILAEDETRE